MDGFFDMTTLTSDEYQNESNHNHQKYNKIKSTKSLIQCDCIFILKYNRNVIQKQDKGGFSLNDQKCEYIKNPYIGYNKNQMSW